MKKNAGVEEYDNYFLDIASSDISRFDIQTTIFFNSGTIWYLKNEGCEKQPFRKRNSQQD